MKFREKIVRCMASILKVHISPKLEETATKTTSVEELPQVVLSSEKDIKLWNEMTSQLKGNRRYVLLTEDADIDQWKNSKANIQSDKETSPVSMVAYRNLINSLYRMLDDAETLSQPTEKKRIIHDIEKSFNKCGLEIVRYDGSNKDLFELKEDLEIEDIQIGTHGIRNTKTGEMLITGVLFIPCKK